MHVFWGEKKLVQLKIRATFLLNRVKVHVNLFQKHLFLHQLTHSKTKDCSLNYKFSMYMKIASSEHVVYINCSECQNKNKKQFVYTTCSELAIFMY